MDVRRLAPTWAAMVIGIALLAVAPAALAIRMTAAFPAGSPTQFVIQPGESTTFAVDYTNLDPGPGIGQAWLYSYFMSDLGTRWTIEPLEPAVCGAPFRIEVLVIEFPVELQALQTLRCNYRVTRAADAYWDGYMALCPGSQPQSPSSCTGRVLLAFGSLPDIAITTTPITAPASGSGDVVLRIDVSNASAVQTADVDVSTNCRGRSGSDPATPLPFQIEVGFPGACPAATQRGCSPEPPLTSFLWSVAIPSIPAHGTFACLVRLRPRQPFTTTIDDVFSLWVGEPYRPQHNVPLLHGGALPGFGRGFDMNPANNVGAFSVIPVLAVPIGWGTSWMLGALLLAIATCWLRHVPRTR